MTKQNNPLGPPFFTFQIGNNQIFENTYLGKSVRKRSQIFTNENINSITHNKETIALHFKFAGTFTFISNDICTGYSFWCYLS